MNARQKAKKLKQELNFIKNQPFMVRTNYKVINVETKHFRVCTIVPLSEIECFGEDAIENEARLQLSRDLMEFIREKIIVNKDRDIDRFHAMKYSTDIWIDFGRSEVNK